MSAKIYFISDPHLGHYNMAIKRGFPDTYCHDENFIAQWNMTVNKHDTVYILGDVTMEKSTNYQILDRLLGYKKVIGGNHDRIQHTIKMLEYVNSFGGVHYIRPKGITSVDRVILTHIPIHPMELEHAKAKGKNFINIHGHIHDGYVIPDKRYINVSAEMLEYRPKTLEELLKT